MGLRGRGGIKLSDPALLGLTDVRRLADTLGLHPSKRRGQNFVVDPNTIRHIVRTAGTEPDDNVVEVGAGLGSLTVGLLATGARVTAVEIDDTLVVQLPQTVAEFAPAQAGRLTVVHADAMHLHHVGGHEHAEPTMLVANLPYNVAVPVLLHMLETFPSIESGLVMVQSEVADRLVAPPGSRTYGVPSVKTAWYADLAFAGSVGSSIFWPAPNVDSALVSWRRRRTRGSNHLRRRVFALIDAAFAQRRKSLRPALASHFGSAETAEKALRAAAIDPRQRGEQLTIEEYIALANAADTDL